MRTPIWRRVNWNLLGLALAAVAIASPRTASADIVHADDVIIQGSLAVGFDAVNGENFGADTIRLKENNLRIHFQDTSSSGSFPSNDWRIVINDSANGGANYFAIEDSDASRQPFRVEAGARANSLYVEGDGDIGIGTSNPVVTLHLVEGNTPTVRLDQDGSQGFTPQVWDLAGNEANFFIRDVTNGSKLPFRITPNTPTSAIRMFTDRIAINDGGGDYNAQIKGDNDNNLLFADASTDQIGIGTDTPGKKLDVVFPSATNSAGAVFRNADGSFEIVNGNGTAGQFLPLMRGNSKGSVRATVFQGNGATGDDTGATPLLLFRGSINEAAVATRPLVGFQNFSTTVGTIDRNGNMVLNGTVTANGILLTSSRELKQDIADLDGDKAADALAGLTPVEYVFKAQPDEKRIGFIAEDVPELVAHKSHKVVPAMEIIAVVTKVVKEQQKTIADQQRKIDELSKKIEALAAAE